MGGGAPPGVARVLHLPQLCRRSADSCISARPQRAVLGDRRAHSRCTSLHRLHALETRSPAALHTAAAPTPLERTAPRRRRLGLRLPARRSTRRSRSPRCGDAPGGRRARNHYYWIHPSGLRSSISACPSLPADPLGGAAVHWRQRSPFRSHTRDRQSSYNPQPCSACAPRTAVRRSLGSRSSTPAAIVPAV